MDRRKKPKTKEQQNLLRQQFYDDVDAGNQSISELVKKMREISSLTQSEFGAHRGVSLRVIKEIEAGTANPSIETLKKIIEIFGLEVTFRRKKSNE